jgi:hypothetical protein
MTTAPSGSGQPGPFPQSWSGGCDSFSSPVKSSDVLVHGVASADLLKSARGPVRSWPVARRNYPRVARNSPGRALGAKRPSGMGHKRINPSNRYEMLGRVGDEPTGNGPAT